MTAGFHYRFKHDLNIYKRRSQRQLVFISHLISRLISKFFFQYFFNSINKSGGGGGGGGGGKLHKGPFYTTIASNSYIHQLSR